MLNVSEVLTILEKEGLTSSRQVVLRWIRQGDLPAIQKTRKEGYQVAQPDLADFIARKKEADASTESDEQTTAGCTSVAWQSSWFSKAAPGKKPGTPSAATSILSATM